MMSSRILLIAAAMALSVPSLALAEDAVLAPRDVPAKAIPVPSADVSPGMQAIIAAPLNPDWNEQWKTAEEARAYADKQAAGVVQGIPDLLARLKVKMEAATMNGVRVHVVTPEALPAENADKVLIHVHGGCYVLFPGEAGTTEAITMAGLEGYKIIAVDYRMPPEAYFPAAVDDAVAVYEEVLKTVPAGKVAFMGTSAGGALTLEMVLRAREKGLPVPGALSVGTPMSDVTKHGDSFYANEKVDNILVSPDGFCDAGTKIYAQGHDLADPLLSPVYGDMTGFPPAILHTGTRDLLLSNTVRVNRKLREAGVETRLEVYEGQSHAQYQFDDRLPETKYAFGAIAEFFAKHLGQ